VILDLVRNLLEKFQAEEPQGTPSSHIRILGTLRPPPPPAFFAWARSEIKACEASGWKDDAYVGAGFRLGELREYVQRTGVD